MIGVIVIKLVLLSLLWSACWCFYFAKHIADVNFKNLSIVCAPWILMFVYIMLFWW